MAILFALVYPDRATAEEAERTTHGLEEAGWLTIMDSSLVTQDEHGKVKHHGDRHTVRTGTVTGALLGGLVGTIFFVPVAGVAAGAAIGAAIGHSAKEGAASDFQAFRDQVGRDLQPGGAALLLLAESDARDRVIHDLGRLGGTLRSTDLSEEQLAAIQAEIDKVAAS
jgi:uncharacterized membrane protein